MELTVSNRAKNAPLSPIRKLVPFADQAKARGTKVYHLNIGQPDLKAPDEFLNALKTFPFDTVEYMPSAGSLALRDSWSEFVLQHLNIQLAPENFIITNGASEALSFTFNTICNPNDEIIVIDPCYANYIGFAAFANVKLVSVPSLIENDFALPQAEQLESKITKNTRAILICNPNNPTGNVFTQSELQRILAVCKKHDLFLVADETYRELVFDTLSPLSMFHLAPDDERIILIDSISKRFSLCGARIGAIMSKNKEFLTGCLKQAQARLSSPTIEQYAATEMLKNIDIAFITKTIKTYQGRRDALYQAMRAIPQVKVSKPQGAFYMIAELPIKNAEEFAIYMLKDVNVNGETTFVAPANGFYIDSKHGQNQVRLAGVLNERDLIRAAEIIKIGLERYNNQ